MKVNAQIKARFLLDKHGEPKSEDDEGTRHYEIELYIESAPSDTFAVTYVLDETYYDQVVESKRKPFFKEEITSYGDYTIVAKVRARSGTYVIQKSLAQALKDEYKKNSDQGIEVALQDIAKN